MDSRDKWSIPDNSVDLIITSPPYPMVEMWDKLFYELLSLESNNSIGTNDLFDVIHQELYKVWKRCFQVLKEGGFACINIGDALRTIDKKFLLYPNHSEVMTLFRNIGFNQLPMIFWRKQTNAPNKFMGSGVLPAGAYVTMENEFILIFRKGDKRTFKTTEEKLKRKQSAFFWEERNKWFCDVWDFKGTKQNLIHKNIFRSAAFPFELPYRLINMYSLKGDTVLDPFLGTGTTALAAMASCRNSIGIEYNKDFNDIIIDSLKNNIPFINGYITNRLQEHLKFVSQHDTNKLKHKNKYYDCPVKSQHETELYFNKVEKILRFPHLLFKVHYENTNK